MYKDKIIRLSLLALLIQLGIMIFCNGQRLSCGFNCCYYKNKHEKSSNNNDNCRLKCHLLSLSAVIYNITNTYSVPSNFSGLSDNSTLDALNKCIKECPDVQYTSYQYNCDKKCCEDYHLPGERRLNDPDACCDGVNMTDVSSLDYHNVLDCSTSNSTCSKKGYRFLLRGNRTVCVSLDSKSPLYGANYGYDDGCSGLYGESGSDKKRNDDYKDRMIEHYYESL
ncbi:SWPV1-071 [Shearwaterpox virus]|uniref:SWPV1-071 n=1 Tax=Shearwaterpox virus TaxID=1974596 RepID=A0A1V0S7T1_CNPV|nr:SWPV1-071 [Shearwaterpox virus]